MQQGSSIDTIFGTVRVDAEYLEAATGEGEAAHRAAGHVLGLQNLRFHIVEAGYTSLGWGDLAPDRVPVYAWRFKKRADDQPPPPSYILGHEIGHDLFIRYLVPSTKADQYGGDAPDWLDEMAAVAFEGEKLRSTRRRAAVRYAREGKLIGLERFLTMNHPEMKEGSLTDAADGEMKAFEPASDDTPKFYAMASAFHDFLVDRTMNPAIVAELAEVVRKGQPLEHWLLTRTGHKSGIAALNADFERWIASDARYGGEPRDQAQGATGYSGDERAAR